MSIPGEASQAPRGGNALTRTVGRWVLRAFGWRLEIQLPDVPHAVVIAAPHTSNWDFVFGMAAVWALGLRVNWLGKHTLFRWPFGAFFRWLGGIPLDRSAPQGAVGETLHAFQDRPQLFLALAPEGTRRRVTSWKRGFYFIAREAGVPIIPAYIDYRRRVVGTLPALYVSGDTPAELGRLRSLYAQVTPRHPELFNPDWD